MIVGMAQAGSINLVQNGEFETTGVHPKSWSPLLDVPAWYSTEGKIEIWAISRR
jgi:hypothetical protein